MIIPSTVPVEDNGCAKAPCGVDASSSDGDGGQVNQENCEPNWKRSQNLQHRKERQIKNEVIQETSLNLTKVRGNIANWVRAMLLFKNAPESIVTGRFAVKSRTSN